MAVSKAYDLSFLSLEESIPTIGFSKEKRTDDIERNPQIKTDQHQHVYLRVSSRASSSLDRRARHSVANEVDPNLSPTYISLLASYSAIRNLPSLIRKKRGTLA